MPNVLKGAGKKIGRCGIKMFNESNMVRVKYPARGQVPKTVSFRKWSITNEDTLAWYKTLKNFWVVGCKEDESSAANLMEMIVTGVGQTIIQTVFCL